ncbi:DNA cytosine methyltransferase [Algicola sagamiensis]|uniref:DNA cytosine methyltransferase n=1 Tax=Algicola sagamiensis TaxID=163869 RepID=UPI00038111B8|nr:DNA cytosine methyltransferase [Algicola sagamiensis]
MGKPSLFSFFSGSGFLDLGFEHNGFDVLFVNEFHKPFLEAYEYSRERFKIDKPIYGYANISIEDLLSGESTSKFNQIIGDAKLGDQLIGFIGGPPCPDFSVGGKNKGKDGENGRLTSVYIDLIIKHKPDFFIFENVKGLWRTQKHRKFYDEMKKKLCENGFLITDRLTNSIEYGAPQDRDRILLFGIRTEIVDCKSNEELEELFKWESEIKFSRKQVFEDICWPKKDVYREDSTLEKPSQIEGFSELTAEYWFRKNSVEKHPNAFHFFKPRAGLSKFQVIEEGDDCKKSFKRLHRWRFSPTAAYGNNEVHLHPYKSRRLSAAEALAIQSLPKEFSLPAHMSLTNMFKTIGNGVPYLASAGLARTTHNFLTQYVINK